MANRSRTGFAKRQKELARSEKRKAKLARRQRAKEEGTPGADGTELEGEADLDSSGDEAEGTATDGDGDGLPDSV